jgi:hypothetical protein
MKQSLVRICLVFVAVVVVTAGWVWSDPLPGETLKFYQVPLNNGLPLVNFTPAGTTQFPGHDELSTAYYSPANGAYTGTYMADDFCDHQSTPILHVTWWGSYLNAGTSSNRVSRFLIAFESDVVSNAAVGYSHPGSNIVSQIVTNGPLAPGSGTFTEVMVPGSISPDGPLYQYNAELAMPFPEQSNVVYWIKIVALVDPTQEGSISWGWHDRDYGVQDPLACIPPSVAPGESDIGLPGKPVWHFQDDAVTGPVTVIPIVGGPGVQVQQTGYTRTFYDPAVDGVSTSKDLAFALYTTAPPPPPPCEALKFYQVPLNNGNPAIPDGGTISAGSVPTLFPGHDELSTAYYNGEFYYGQYMADDFCDYLSAPIVHVTWWGSYLSNYVGNAVQQFLIAFESDVSTNDPNNQYPFSHPGSNIVSQVVTRGPLALGSGTFVEKQLAIPPGPANPDGNLYQYDAELAIPVPETSNTVQWIKIVALTTDQQLRWGWHNRDYGIEDPLACRPPGIKPGESNSSPTGGLYWHFQDDAVTGVIEILPGTNVVQQSYAPTFYDPQFDGIPYSKDLAFALYTLAPSLTFDQWQLLYFGCTICPQADAGADPDGDGASNTNEFLAGTVPTNSASYFHVTSIVRTGVNSNDVTLTWAAVGGHSYVVQTNSPPVSGDYTNNFSDLSLDIPAPGVGEISLSYTDAGGGTNQPTRYYRVRLGPPLCQ